VNLSIRYSKPLQFVFAALVFFASSGATAVIRQCTMASASCCGTASCDDDAYPQPVAPPSGQSIRAEFTCQVTTLIGGLAIRQGVVEQAHKPLLHKILAVSVVAHNCALTTHSHRSSSPQLFADAASPPPVEKYVLNASFLI